MLNLWYVMLGCAQLTLAVYGVLRLKLARQPYTWLILAVIFALAYDNFILAAGIVLGEGGLLRALNAARFGLHALLTPTLAIAGFGLARRAGLGWARSRAAHAAACLGATALIGLGLYEDVWLLRLEPELENGALRYVNGGGLAGPPLAPILTILFLLAAGALIGRANRWPWLALGALAMFAAYAGGPTLLALGNLGEVALSAALLASARRFNV